MIKRLARFTAAVIIVSMCSAAMLPDAPKAQAAKQAARVAAPPSCTIPAPTTAAGYEQLLRGPINGKIYTGDSGHSVKLPNGKILWMFGDTFVRDASQNWGGTFINNAAILTDGGCATALTGPANAQGQPTSWITPTGTFDNPALPDYYWSSTAHLDGNKLHVFMMHMYNDASGFHSIGVDIATFNVSGAVPQFVGLNVTPGSASGEALPQWGAALMPTAAYTYIYGRTYVPGPYVFGHNYFVARVSTDKNIINPAAWQYWNGTTWVKNPAAAAAIIPGVAGAGSGATIHQKADGTYVMVTKKYDIVGSDIATWTAPAPQGPWTAGPALLAPIPDVNAAAKEITYFGLGHRAIPLASGKLLVSWSLNSTDAAWFGNPRYGLHFAEVTQP